MVCRCVCIVLLCFCSVVMPTVPSCVVGWFGFVCPIVSLGINLYFCTREYICCAINKFNLATNNNSTYIDRPNFVALSVFGIHPNIIACSVRNYRGKFPSSYGHGNEHYLACRIIVSRTGNCNGSNILIGIRNNVRSGKALCNFHVIEFPFAYVVKVYIRTDRFNFFDIGRNKVNVVNRTEEYVVESCIMCNKFNC